MARTFSGLRTSHRQAGAALVVGLMLLLILTVLAISGVNSTSLNLVMAGNTQYTQNAFQNAETGIERSMKVNVFNPDPNLAPETRTETKADTRVGFNAVSRTQLCGNPQPALPGSSFDSYATYHFQIESTGTAERGASARNIQAVAVIAPADSTFAPPNICSGGGGLGERTFD